MNNKKNIGILFIGNSHTYHNDVPLMVRNLADEEGFNCRVTMLAHPNWFLSRHAEEPEARFNILYGKYDYVVLQEHAHPFGPEESFLSAAIALNRMIREAGSIPVIYECWSRKDETEAQDHMNEVHRHIAEEISALLAPVGESWHNQPGVDVYDEDGAHASPAGSCFAAQCIWKTILDDIRRKETKDAVLSV